MSFFVKKAADNQAPDFDATKQLKTQETVDLYEAAAIGDVCSMQQALMAGGNPNYMNRPADGATSLHVAARNKNSKASLEFLVGVGGFVGAKLLGNYNTPLHEALGCWNDEGAKVLIELGDSDVAGE